MMLNQVWNYSIVAIIKGTAFLYNAAQIQYHKQQNSLIKGVWQLFYCVLIILRLGGTYYLFQKHL